jgi:hypothetical protein
MEAEHCKKAGCNTQFHSTNYNIFTTPAQEWGFVVLKQTVPAEKMLHGRKIPSIEDLKQLDVSIKARLQEIEIIAVVQYTGPMV